MWPGWFSKTYIWMLARLYFICSRKQVKIIRNNIAKAMTDRTPSETKEITRGVLRGVIQHYQEKMINGFLSIPSVKELLISNVGLDGHERVLENALEEGRGVIIATGHYGAMEFLPPYLAFKKYPAVVIAKFSSERLQRISVSRANSQGLGIIVPGNGTNVFREAVKVLSQNKILVTQCDETDEWHSDRHTSMEFLGKMIHPDRMLRVLCKKTGAVLLFGVLLRQGEGQYKLVLHRMPDAGDSQVNVRTLKLLEKYIYEHPEQWYEWKKYHKYACPT